ncbi:MAG: hypothetical protein AAF997_14975, partial [Myxococcota bacterium]
MDTAMRDLERIEERSSDEGNRILLMSGVGLIAAMGIVVGAVAALPESGASQEQDPLEALILADVAGIEAGSEEPKPDPDIDPKTLSFPTTL